MLSHVLYGANADYIARLVEESVINVSREHADYTSVAEALQLLRPDAGDSLHRLQIKFFLLLNEDEAMRRSLSHVKPGHALVASLCGYKAERFYDDLCERFVPTWIQDARVTDEAFVDSLRQAYLCS